ncbi:LexA/Signal peptidase [Polyplosphaeria fusca]|uniref:Mitochondrial inner membrane protease subunit n=1 Tax=Polyplosphaeria fusca TaxID=682080 RepID=A0A9P4UZ44_9PLEO|nr:LexA/Signal peptidase [Polyplosphaeria fusca]
MSYLRNRIPSFFSHLRNLRTTFRRPPIKPLKSALPGQYENNAFFYMLTIANIYLAIHIIPKYLIDISSVSGVSMAPTITPSDYSWGTSSACLISLLHRRGRWVKVGDLVVYTHPLDRHKRALKRVVGMPGDWVAVMTPGKNNAEDGDAGEVGEQMFQVPEGHCWLAGDNLEWSRDSRVFGPIPLALVRGKVFGVVWPWRHRRWFGGEGLQDPDL